MKPIQAEQMSENQGIECDLLPFRKLVTAMIEQARDDMIYRGKDWEIFRETADWYMKQRDHNYPLSFENCCIFLKQDVDRMEKGIRDWSKKQERWL